MDVTRPNAQRECAATDFTSTGLRPRATSAGWLLVVPVATSPFKMMDGLLRAIARSWVVQSVLTLAVVLSLSRPRAFAAPSTVLLAQPPSVGVLSQRATPSGDLSAAVRVHRGGRSIDVWLVTPHSAHWATLAAVSSPLQQQLATKNWPPPGTAARFEPLQRPGPALSAWRRSRMAPALARLAKRC